MKAGTHNHMKTKRLKRLLGIPLYRAVGILETIWLLCADCCDEGNIGKFTDEEIADYLEWDGDASELVRALSDSGWTDSDKDSRLVVHDWLEHCPEYIKDRVRKREARSVKVAKTGNDFNKQRTYEQSEPDKTGQDRTKTGHDPATTVYSQPIPTQPIPTNPIICGDKESDKESCLITEFVKAWNDTPGTTRIERLKKGKRLSSLQARLKESDWRWKQALAKFPLKCFADDGGFTPHLEWFTRPDTVDSIIEGKYDWQKTNGNSNHAPPPPPRVIGVPEPVQFLPGRGPPKTKESDNVCDLRN